MPAGAGCPAGAGAHPGGHAAKASDAGGWRAWVGPGIGPDAFEVGRDVLDAFMADDPATESYFRPAGPARQMAGRPAWTGRVPLAARGRRGRDAEPPVHGCGRRALLFVPARRDNRADGAAGLAVQAKSDGAKRGRRALLPWRASPCIPALTVPDPACNINRAVSITRCRSERQSLRRTHSGERGTGRSGRHSGRVFREWQRLCDDARQGALPPPSDRRFAGPAWAAQGSHLLMAHAYLLSARAMSRLVDAAQVSERCASACAFRHAMGGRAVAVQLPGAQSRCTAVHRGKRRPRADRRRGQPAGRRQERAHHPDRRIAVRDRPQRGRDAGRSGVREPADPADPVRP